MTLDQMLKAIFPTAAGALPRPSAAQGDILQHRGGPAWILAGPGSGKTDTLALFILRLVFVDGVAPESIFATTFTEKAAKNLDDRIADYRGTLASKYPTVESVDLSRLRLGTLHGLCNDVLQEFRAPNYQNVRLMDQFETAMFVNEHVSFIKRPKAEVNPFWTDFESVFEGRWKASTGKGIQWQMAAKGLITLFNRIAEDNVDVEAMRAAGGTWKRLAELYDDYVAMLTSRFRCDFAQLQRRFLDFLNTKTGAEFMEGTSERRAIAWVLVDEYQDTNLIQEAIYMKLAGQPPHNIVVVGDDDQAMYRFRGGSVECMVTFDEACLVHLGIDPKDVRSYPLVENYRSHSSIVQFYDEYITAFAEMNAPGARAPGKKPLIAKSKVGGNYVALGIIEGTKAIDAPASVAQLIHDLHAHGIITDYSQCCILLHSTKEGPQNAGPYVGALRQLGIPVYNPRSGTFLAQQEVLTLVGALLAFVDPQGQFSPVKAPPVMKVVNAAREAYASAASGTVELQRWMAAAKANLALHADTWCPIGLQDVMYLVLSFEPFKSWQEQPIPRVRLAKITKLVESYAALPVPKSEKARRGSLRVAADGIGINKYWSDEFFNLFLGYLTAEGVNDEEDDDVIVPRGAVPIMTMHQSKGLEFPFVFTGHMGKDAKISAAHG